jgi:hypothetical protein
MPAPTILKRTLTFHFPRSVTATKQLPQTLEVVIVPLSDPSAPDQGTYVGGLQKQNVLLDDDDNVISFSLVPSNSPQLLAPVNYRAAWREGSVLGRTFTYDFAMPDSDIRFDELADLGQIIGGDTYLKQTDLGVPGRVAKLNSDGVPVDINGHPAAGALALTSLANMLDDETTARMAGDATSLTQAQAFTSAQIADLAGQTQTDLDDAVSTLQTAINNEVTARQSNIAAEITSRTSADTALGTRIDGVTSSVETINTALGTKATLTDGKVPLSQIPLSAITKSLTVTSQAARLALTSADVQPGDFVVQPDGVFILNGSDPSLLNSWTALSKVNSVNGYQGAVNLTSAGVGAIATGTSFPISQITGLATALADKVTAAQLSSLTATVTAIQNDPTLVRATSGVVPRTLSDGSAILSGTALPNGVAGLAYVNSSNQVTLKNGTVIASGTGDVYSINGRSGAVTLTAADVPFFRPLATALPISDITGLQTALDGKASSTDSRLTNTRTPNAHAASHASGGSDAITIAVSQVTGLSTTLSGLASAASTTALTNRVGSLETTVTQLQGTGGGSPVSKDVWWNAATSLTGITTPGGMKTAGVILKSPFGRAADGSYYYNPNGATGTEVVWPHITPNGHLQFRAWNEAGAADVVYAPQTSLDRTDAAVALKASQIDLDALSLAVRTKAAQNDFAALSVEVSSKASTVALNALNNQVTTLAKQSQVDGIAIAVASKVAQTDFDQVSQSVSAKANQSDLAAATARIDTLVLGQSTKADLVTVGQDKKIPLAQIPANIPLASISGLQTALDGKASLTNGKLTTGQIPDLQIGNITNLQSTLDSKATLVNGKLSTSQIPAIITHETYAKTSRAGMLALTTAQVQIGDQCIITEGDDKGTYTLIANDPTQFANWMLNTAPNSPVTKVNNKIGDVTLTAADVGAYPSSSPLAITNVAGLEARFTGLATTSALNDGLNGKTSPDTVRQLISQTSQIKKPVGYVATVSIDTLNGINKTIDGVTVASGRVLLTAQASPATNGIYDVAAGNWQRVSDMLGDTYFINGTLVTVSGGAINSNTVWQLNSPSGKVGTDANNWTKILQAGPPTTYQAGSGLTLSGNTISAKASTQALCGIAVTSQGLSVDATVVARKYVGAVPTGSSTCTITHNLNTTSPLVQVIGGTSGEAVLVGWTVTGPNTISLDFASTVTSSTEWRVVVIG